MSEKIEVPPCYMGNMELVITCDAPPEKGDHEQYAHKVFAARIAAGLLDLKAERRKVALAEKRIRELPDDELIMLSIGLDDEDGLSILAGREHCRRSEERGYPIGGAWTRESWEAHCAKEEERRKELEEWARRLREKKGE